MAVTLEELAERETGVAVVEADRSEVLAVLDARTRAEVGMSADEFLARLRTGGFNGCDEVAVQRLIGISALLG